MSASTEFVASLPFLGCQQRNAVLDNFFYDTASLTVEEKAKLSRRSSIARVAEGRHHRGAARQFGSSDPTFERMLRFMRATSPVHSTPTWPASSPAMAFPM
jgi:hypothetical protein